MTVLSHITKLDSAFTAERAHEIGFDFPTILQELNRPGFSFSYWGQVQIIEHMLKAYAPTAGLVSRIPLL